MTSDPFGSSRLERARRPAQLPLVVSIPCFTPKNLAASFSKRVASSPACQLRVRMYRDWGRQADINKSENRKHKQLPRDYNPRFIYEKIGYNFQILELQAAMGRVQLRKTPEIKRKRWANFRYLYNNLQKYPLQLPLWHDNANPCWFAFPISSPDRAKLLPFLEKRGIETRPMFAGDITAHPAYKDVKYRKMNLKSAEVILTDSFWISCHPALTKKDLKYIVKTFDDFFA